MGPTGAGKTELAAEIVARLPLEIVSVDAAMVYRGMDIGTAKPTPALLERAPHHLIDLIDPAESYSAARFVADAESAIANMAARGRSPFSWAARCSISAPCNRGLPGCRGPIREIRQAPR